MSKYKFVKKFFLFLIFFCITTISFATQKYPSVGIVFHSTPFMVDTNENGFIKFNITAFGSYTFDKFTFRFDTNVNINNFTQINNKQTNLVDLSIKEIFIFKIAIIKQFCLEFNTGFGWTRQSNQLNITERFSDYFFDLQLGLSSNFYIPFKYINFCLYNNVDFYINHNLFLLKSANYFRFNTIIYYSFLNIFTDLGLCYDYNPTYKNTYPYFSYQMGISIQFDFKRNKSNPKKIYIFRTVEQEKIIEKEVEKIVEKTPAEKQHERFIEIYKKDFAQKHVGDTIDISGLSFPTKSIDILPGTAARLNALAEVLTDKNFHFAISCYTETIGNPEEEIAFAIQRANTIKYFLVARGIPSNNIKISSNAIVYPKNTPNTEKIIQIKIIK